MMQPRVVGRGAAFALLLMTSGMAMADPQLSAEVGVNGGISTNPYGSAVSNASSATLNGTFTPTLSTAWPTGSLGVTGRLSHTEYSRRYDGTTDYTLSAHARQQLSPLASISGSLGYIDTVRNALYPVIDPGTVPGEDPNDPVIVDPSAAVSYAERTRSFTGSLGLNMTMSARDTISVSARGTHVNVPARSAFSRDYDNYGGTLSYMRAIAQNTSIGLSFDTSRVNYGSTQGKSTVYAPALVLNTHLSARLSFNASAGASFSDTELPGGTIHSTSFSGSAGLCYKGDRANYCFRANRSVSPTTLSGASTVTSLAATYSYVLSPRSSINANVSYARARSIQGLGNRNTDYGQASIGYSRRLGPRLSAVISASYSDTYESFVDRGANFYGTIGLRYRLGNI